MHGHVKQVGLVAFDAWTCKPVGLVAFDAQTCKQVGLVAFDAQTLCVCKWLASVSLLVLKIGAESFFSLLSCKLNHYYSFFFFFCITRAFFSHLHEVRV
jgi:hypothetical protein